MNEGSYDNCSNAISLAVRRTSGCLGTSSWSNEVTFSCCDDVVTVELRVTDEAGNSNICWKETHLVYVKWNHIKQHTNHIQHTDHIQGIIQYSKRG